MSFSARSNRDAASVSGRSSIKPLERRIPTNKKYENIKSSLDTGSSMNKVQYITQGQYIKRQSEIFYRVSPSDMYAMFTEYERHADENMAPGAYAGGGGAGGGPRIVVHEEEKTCERYYELQKWLQRLRSEGQGAATPALGASQLQDGSAAPVGKVGPSVCLRLTRVVATARGGSAYACGAGACGEARAGVRPSL